MFMARPVKRTKRKRVSDQTDGTTLDNPATRPPKRTRGRKGTLKRFPEMPVDVLLQVNFLIRDNGLLTQCLYYLTLHLRFLITYVPLIYST